MKNIADLREHLFGLIEALADPERKIDLRRVRLTHDLAERIIDTARVEVQFAAVLRGATDVPFIEAQDPQHPSNKPEKPALQPADPMARAAQVLTAGPSQAHPWRQGDRKRA